MKFETYNISSQIKKNLAKLGFKKPTDIQYKAIPTIMKGEDMLAIAQTGTGKTAAFAIPIINKIHTNKSSKRSMGIKCIVMVPTRELSQQIGEVFNQLAKHTKVTSYALFGGVEQEQQITKLQDGIDILITTPGRMFDLINQKHIKVNYVHTFVLDEADHMLELGFIEDIRYVKKMLLQQHQTLFISATINDRIKRLAFAQVNSSAIRIQISPKDPVSKNVSHFVMYIEMDDKRFFLERFIKEHLNSKIIVFVRTKVRAERVVKAMQRVDIDTLTIHSSKDQKDRTEIMNSFRKGTCKILIATDISARGIDIPDIEYVINYDLPDKAENYVHRVGRCGRAFNKGIAVSFSSKEEADYLKEIEVLLGKEIDEIKVNKRDYTATVLEKDFKNDFRKLIDENEVWMKKSKKKRNAKKKDKKPSSKSKIESKIKTKKKTKK